MKKFLKFFVLVLMFICAVVLTGCSDDSDDLISLEQSVTDLQTMIEELQSDRDILYDEIQDLLDEIEKLEKDVDSKESIIYALRNEVAESYGKLREVQNEMALLESKIEATRAGIRVMLADEYTLVVGDNFQLFYRSIVQAPDPYGYYIKLTGKKGHAYNRYYEFCPEANEVGTYELKVSVCDANGVEYGSDTTKLVVVSDKVSASENKEKTILCFGDSLTYSGQWVAQGISKYVKAGYTNVKTIGSMSKEIGGVKSYYEGNSGWQWSTYINGNGGTPSPFKSSEGNGKISFKEYAKKYNVDKIDEVYILLTWNGIGGANREFNFNDSLFSYAKKIVDKFHEEFPEGKITLIGIPKPSMNAGLGAYYEIGIGYSDNYGQSVTVMNYNQFMEDWCKMEEYKSFMRYVDGMGQFDSEYNMPTQGKPVNNQNSTTEPVGNAMGMHPTSNGYLQIGDTFFRALMKGWK